MLVEDSLTIFGKPNCPNCEKAKLLCQMKGVEFVYKALGLDYNLEELLELIPKEHRTFPVVFNGEAFLGGYKELEQQIKGA